MQRQDLGLFVLLAILALLPMVAKLAADIVLGIASLFQSKEKTGGAHSIVRRARL
jgi:hypothetical protein